MSDTPFIDTEIAARTQAQWREILSPLEYHVLREGGTERPGTGALLHENRVGTYTCRGCNTVLFRSDAKFDAGCGWPSFFEAQPGSVLYIEDFSHGMIRTEVRCAHCDSHLGHIFDDAPQTPTGKRYCMNSASLAFVEASNES
ncbi:MAG: peptide-methionine (R)-S-oxide reductase MsrB [Actinomycetaceae bacterium]|nr:peptide-methionine (R)-S-oxide reductase MsrB [Actinomycetaceae bacterium]